METKRVMTIYWQQVAFMALLLVLGATWWGSQWWMERRGRIRIENEYTAHGVLKNLAQAEADFRFNDRDGNGVNDFWTADVAGLYSIDPGNGPIRLISRGVAEADARPLHALVPKPIPYHGYFFMAMDQDDREDPPEPYRQDTDKKSGKVHHLSRFAFCAFPAGPEEGKVSWIIDQGNTAFMSRWGMITPFKNWPNDFREDWSPQ